MKKNNPKKGIKINRKVVEDFIQKVCGKAHLLILIKNKPALELCFCDKEIIAEIKNPILAMTLGLEHFIKKKEERGNELGFVKELKKLGYKIKIKYKMFEFEL